MFGEIFICQFPFTSGVVSKVRPALVLFDLQQDVLICRVTSRNAPARWTSYWSIGRQLGLLRPSVARLDGVVTAERKVLIRRLGVLSSRDKESIRTVWNQRMKL
jgi:hypothetical protein